MAAVCQTDPETLKATFFVRKFTTMNSDIRAMAAWLKSMAYRMSVWNQQENTGSLCSIF